MKFDCEDLPKTRYQWIDYLREAMTLKFEGHKLMKVSYLKIDWENRSKLSAIEMQIGRDIHLMSQKKMGWLRCHSFEKRDSFLYRDAPVEGQEGKTKQTKGSVIYTLFFTDIDKDLDKAYLRVTASRYWERSHLELPADEFFTG